MKTKPFLRHCGAISDLIVGLCGFLFLFSALDKFADYESFRTQIGKSPILTGYEDTIAWAVPVLEVLVTAAITWSVTRIAGLYMYFTIMMLFIIYILMLTHLDVNAPCGCNFLTEKMGPTAHILMNIVFAVLAVLAICIETVHSYQQSFISKKKEVGDNE